MEEIKTVFIQSIGKRVSMEEFENYLPKVGDVVVLNDSNFIRRKEDENGYIHFEQFICLKVSDKFSNAGTIQICYNPDYNGISSLLLANRIASGEYKIIDGSVFDVLLNSFTNFYDSTKEIMNNH